MNSLDRLCIDTIRFLAVDAVEKARSGHPGMPLGAAPMAYALWDRVLRFNPSDPAWFNRDRFVLSAGHGSALLYGLLHLYGYDLPLEELVNFRQWGSRTPGHPEYGRTPGVEATTGPLGQGFGMGVGMAMAEAHLAARFNMPGEPPVVDHHTYAIVSDGDLMEGISSEAASLAAKQKLGKLVYLYDDNHITIDGSTSLAFTEDVGRRFEAYGWHVQAVEEGNDIDAIERALIAARGDERPSLIRVRTHIGYGSPRQDSPKAHGEPLGAEGVRATKEKLGWPLEPLFHVPDEVRAHCRERGKAGAKLESEWSARVYEYGRAHAAQADLLKAARTDSFPKDWDRDLAAFSIDKPIATRKASGQVINALAARLPALLGGSADLTGSNDTRIESSDAFEPGAYGATNVHFGVREHAMGAILNGMALHGGVRPFGGTFLVFSDYMRPAIRLAALMRVPTTFVFTHDSIGLGEDGPTHQPVEHLASLRAIPGMTVFRPADARETSAAWTTALALPGPRAIVLTRQALPVLDVSPEVVRRGVARGAYVVSDSEGRPQVVIVATGSEVQLALAAQKILHDRHFEVRVVSMPCRELFLQQSPRYRSTVLPKSVHKLAVEAASPMGWRDIVGDRGGIVALDRFGASAPGPVLMEKLGFNVENVVNAVMRLLPERRRRPRTADDRQMVADRE